VSFPDLGSDPTGAGDHPTTRGVQVSLDDPDFADPVDASVDEASGTWQAPLGDVDAGSHTVYARARVGTTTSDVASSTFNATPDARVEWQIVDRNAAPAPDGWRTADGIATWSFAFSTGDYGNGQRTLVSRLVEGGLETARATVSARFR
jgi:hypothetical protein